MRARRAWTATAIGTVLGLAWAAAATGRTHAADAGLTFFGWSDQHVATSGDGQHLLPAIDAMNSLPGVKYPADIGGASRRARVGAGLRGYHRMAHRRREEHL